jgi:hypothetical protein
MLMSSIASAGVAEAAVHSLAHCSSSVHLVMGYGPRQCDFCHAAGNDASHLWSVPKAQ